MSKIAAFLLIALGAWASPALAQRSTCSSPALPGTVDPAHATADQVRGMLAAAQSFIATSDAYEACLVSDLQAQKDQAKSESRPFDPAIEAAIHARITANQKDKDKVGSDATYFMTAFKRVHACEGKPLTACQN